MKAYCPECYGKLVPVEDPEDPKVPEFECKACGAVFTAAELEDE